MLLYGTKIKRRGSLMTQTKTLRQKFIGDKTFYKMVLAVAVPIIIQNGITNLVNVLDNVMVGQLGTESMSGVAIANQLIFVFNLCIFGGLSGAGIFGAQYHGSGNADGVRQTFRFKLYVVAALSAIFLTAFITKDAELLSMHKSRLDSTCYQDEALHLLTMDIVFYGSNYMSEDLFGIGNNYWPSLKDYDPGITKDMWIAILQDESVTTDEARKLLNMFLELGGESSFNNLVAHFGNQFYYKGKHYF